MVRAVLEGRETVTRRLVTRMEGLGPTESGKSDSPSYAWYFRDRRALRNAISGPRLPGPAASRVGLYVRARHFEARDLSERRVPYAATGDAP